MTPCNMLDYGARLGEFVGGFATVAAVWLGYRELHKWREQKRAEKRSESAARALLAVQETCIHVHHWCTVLAMEATQDRGSDDARRQGIESAVQSGHRDVAAIHAALRRAAIDTSLYLEPDERKILFEVVALLNQADADATWWPKRVGTIERETIVRTFVELSRLADTLRERAERTLIPIARFDEPVAPRVAGAGPAGSP